jgi:hypothetical protein
VTTDDRPALDPGRNHEQWVTFTVGYEAGITEGIEIGRAQVKAEEWPIWEQFIREARTLGRKVGPVGHREHEACIRDPSVTGSGARYKVVAFYIPDSEAKFIRTIQSRLSSAPTASLTPTPARTLRPTPSTTSTSVPTSSAALPNPAPAVSPTLSAPSGDTYFTVGNLPNGVPANPEHRWVVRRNDLAEGTC